MIVGVEFKKLQTHSDRRGFFRELIRNDDPFFKEGFAQVSHSMLFDETTKAWHMHNLQIDWWYVCTGVLRVGLCDLRNNSSSYKETLDFYLGDFQEQQIIKIPPLVAHGCQVIQGPVNLFYITSHTYNPQDEIRISHDTPDINFSWSSHYKIT